MSSGNVASRSMVLNFGKKLIEGPTTEIFANDEVAAVYLGTGGDREPGAGAGSTDGRGGDIVHVGGPAAERRVMSPLIASPSTAVAGRAFARIEGDLRKLRSGSGAEGHRPHRSRRRGHRRTRRQRRRQDDARAHDQRRHRADLGGFANRGRGRVGSAAASDRRARNRALHGGPAHFPDAFGSGESADRGPERERIGLPGTSRLPSTICFRSSPNARTRVGLRCRAANSRCSRSDAP